MKTTTTQQHGKRIYYKSLSQTKNYVLQPWLLARSLWPLLRSILSLAQGFTLKMHTMLAWKKTRRETQDDRETGRRQAESEQQSGRIGAAEQLPEYVQF